MQRPLESARRLGETRSVTRRKPALRVGTSGWQYDHWRGLFYPKPLPRRRWFAWYAQHFDSVEVNATFYRLPEPHIFDAWRDEAPEGFSFALKFSRYGSHLKHLQDPRGSIGAFLERARRLGDRLGPILVQLPPRWRPDLGRLDAFLAAAPRSRRWAVEFRDPRWLGDATWALLRRHRAALCVHDLLEDHPRVVTTDWVYLRFHGVRHGGRYSPQALAAEARRIRRHLACGRDVHAYFNNDRGGYAVRNAADLRRYVKGRRPGRGATKPSPAPG